MHIYIYSYLISYPYSFPGVSLFLRHILLFEVQLWRLRVRPAEKPRAGVEATRNPLGSVLASLASHG